MPWLIDAANLGGVLGGASGARNAPAILQALLPWARERKQVVVVFDGPEQTQMATRLGGVEIVWSETASADDFIAKRIAKAGKAAKSWTVITNDRALARRCKDLGAQIESAEVFARKSSHPKRNSKSAHDAQAAADKPAPNAREIAHWKAIFGDGGKNRGEVP